MPEIATKERMIAAAATLFARAGFNGITTRDIAQRARVSEGNIFRYFPTKRELFIAAIDSELAKLSIRLEALDKPATVEDPRAALRSLFEMITNVVVNQPELVRLMRFSALEFGPDLDCVYRRHMSSIISATASNFKKWSHCYGFRDLNARATVLSFVATVVLLQNYPVFTDSDLPVRSVEDAAAEYAELWYRVLADEPRDDLPPSGILPVSLYETGS